MLVRDGGLGAIILLLVLVMFLCVLVFVPVILLRCLPDMNGPVGPGPVVWPWWLVVLIVVLIVVLVVFFVLLVVCALSWLRGPREIQR